MVTLFPHLQVKAMYEELAGSLGELMKKRRSGVVAALVAACGSKGCCQREICAELEKVSKRIVFTSVGTRVTSWGWLEVTCGSKGCCQREICAELEKVRV